jgi:hypothetical protein
VPQAEQRRTKTSGTAIRMVLLRGACLAVRTGADSSPSCNLLVLVSLYLVGGDEIPTLGGCTVIQPPSRPGRVVRTRPILFVCVDDWTFDANFIFSRIAGGCTSNYASVASRKRHGLDNRGQEKLSMVKQNTKAARYQLGPFTYDSAHREFFKNGKPIHLTGKKLDILEVLINKFPTWISRKDLHSSVWAGETTDIHVVSTHVSHLATILGPELMMEGGYRLRHKQQLRNDDRDPLHPSWCEVCEAAKKIGAYVFDEFRANVILTFAGHSAIFANLVLVKSLSRAKMLSVPVYLALQRDWDQSVNRELPTLPGYEAFPGESVAVLVPRALIDQLKAASKTLRIAVIDDAIVSGSVPMVLKTNLKLPKKARMVFACYVGYWPVVDAMKPREPEKVIKWLRTPEELRAFRLPCDTPLLWFGQRLSSGATSD